MTDIQDNSYGHNHDGVNSPKIYTSNLIDDAGYFGTPSPTSGQLKSISLTRNNSEYLLIADANQTGLGVTTTFTFEAWIKPTILLATGNIDILAKTEYASYDKRISYSLSVDNTGRLVLTLSDNGTNDAGHYLVSTTDSVQVYVGVWTHVAVTCDMSSPTIHFYVNGTSVSSTNTGTIATSLFNNDVAFTIGTEFSGVNLINCWGGFIDDVRVWNAVRTGSQISNNYKTELVGNESNLMGYWRLNGNLYDYTSNKNNLTKGNNPVFSSDWHG